MTDPKIKYDNDGYPDIPRPMTDIVERLREFFQAYTNEQDGIDQDGDAIMKEAADEIEELRRLGDTAKKSVARYRDEIERLRRDNINIVLCAQVNDEQATALLKQNAELLEALQRITNSKPDPEFSDLWAEEAWDIARSAIEKTK